LKEGFWSVHYASEVAGGFGVIALDTGTVVGADATGGIWDGTYSFNNRSGMLDVRLRIKFPPHVLSTVTGEVASDGYEETYEVALPNDLGRETAINLTVLGVPVVARFKKIRDFP